MTLDELKNYRLYCSEIKDIELQLKSSSSDESTVTLLYRKRELIDKKDVIEKFVKNIPEYKIRRAIIIYYLEPILFEIVPSWEKVADRIADGSTGDSLRMAVSRFLKNS